MTDEVNLNLQVEMIEPDVTTDLEVVCIPHPGEVLTLQGIGDHIPEIGTEDLDPILKTEGSDPGQGPETEVGIPIDPEVTPQKISILAPSKVPIARSKMLQAFMLTWFQERMLVWFNPAVWLIDFTG